jgi:tetratricopeptide (TPR) repeat protein
MTMAFGGENAEAYYDDGLTASMRGEVERAIGLFRKAIELDNALVPAYQQLGRCYARIGEPENAARVLTQVVSKRPDNHSASMDLGLVFIQLDRADEARSIFQRILDADPANGRASLGLAQCAFAGGDWKTAVAEAQAAQALGGTNFQTLYLLGRAARLAGNTDLSNQVLEKAEKLMEKTAEMTPHAPESHYLRGEVCFALERFGAAREHFREAEDRADSAKNYAAFGEYFTKADMIAKQGLCYQRLGHSERARDEGKRVLALDPDHRMGKALAALE